ncbi:hypothetical protein CLOM_g15214 [Closterium sp. NIES-68]|nr:hypothetical protein CLOM_g15214 [Closterium sp. NIES-68]GJP78016.1 hypothetical protein CLOP_g8349 [Closterium sp. NIES-67]
MTSPSRSSSTRFTSSEVYLLNNNNNSSNSNIISHSNFSNSNNSNSLNKPRKWMALKRVTYTRPHPAAGEPVRVGGRGGMHRSMRVSARGAPDRCRSWW